MLGPEEPHTEEQELAEIAEAQRRLVQLLAKSVAEELASKRETRESHSNPTDEQR